MLYQIPDSVQDKIYSGFLFHEFLGKIQQFFRLSKATSKNMFQKSKIKIKSYYTWNDQQYRDFVLQVLTLLEPRFEKKHTILIDELDEFNEILFFSRGQVAIGYEINKQRWYCLRYIDKSVIGAYGLTFNQRAAFIYTTLTNCHGFSIRKVNWKKILDENPEMSIILKQNVLMQYLTQVRSKVLVKKKRAIIKMSQRNDHQMILASEHKDYETAE